MYLIKKPERDKKVRLVIIGAGKGGELISRYIFDNPDLNYDIIAFIDDDREKIGKELCGIPIYGPIDNIWKVLLEKDADEILIAAPSISGEIIKRVTHSLRYSKIKIKILPSSFETPIYLEEGKADFEQVRELKIEDFFRRKPITTDFKKIKDYFSEMTVLVTGAAGSIGSELCRQLLLIGIKKLIALDNRESALHELNLVLSEKYGEKIIPVIADIKEKEKIRKIFKKYTPSIIFHAAAYKHVPMMELHPDEAIKTNIFGTKNIIDLVDELKIKNFVLVSTDKAVNPKSIMGATKYVAEKIMQTSQLNNESRFLAVRFGNVINSDGSVVPLFEKQIEKGGPVTVTHPEMKRFFMTIPEAAQLVIQSVLIGKNKELFVLDMGEQYSVLELAEDIIKLRGFEPYKDIDIKITDLRKGEKLHEELTSSNEIKESTENKRIFLIKNSNLVNKEKLDRDLEELRGILNSLEEPKLLLKLKEMVPNFLKESSKEDFLPYNRPMIGEEELEEVADTLKSGWLTMGPKTIKFEEALAKYIGVKHAISVSSCTAGLHLSLIVLGIGKGDEVITTPFTFAATGNVICHVGAKPVFVDIEQETFNIDPSKIECAITDKTKAILVVHYAGQSANLEEIKKIADKHNLKIIEDAAHALGSEYKGKKIGAFGNLTSFSFYVTKNMTTGDGGVITTNDDYLAERLKILRLHGISKDAWKRYGNEGKWYYEIEECGWKYNMTDIEASLGIHQLKKLDFFTEKRTELAQKYSEFLSKVPGIKIPKRMEDRKNNFHLYPILLEEYSRDKFIKEIAEKNIGTSVHFIPLHLHPFYQKNFGYKEGDFPITEKVYKKIVSLPLYPLMSYFDVERVIVAIREILSENKISLVLREVNESDCKYLYEWRNHPTARAVSRFTEEIPYEEHVRWFLNSLKDPKRKIYIGMENGERIGQIRFDKNESKSEVSVTINPEKYGKGYGSLLIKEGSKKYFMEELFINRIIAEIKPENRASMRVFEKAGFKKISEKNTIYGMFLIFELNRLK